MKYVKLERKNGIGGRQMIINPTKKSLPLFSALPKVKDVKIGKAYSTVNPFFSWHANYYNVNRKKILVIVNDLTMISIVIADVNAQRKKDLDRLIKEGIKVSLDAAGATQEEIEKYFELAGEIEVNVGFNRQVTSVTTNFITSLEILGPIDWSNENQYHLMAFLSEYVISSLPDTYPIEALQKTLAKGFSLQPVTEAVIAERDKKKKVDAPIEVTWKDFHHWDSEQEIEAWGEDFVIRMEEIIENNQLVLVAFEKYLYENLGLSKKVVKRHLRNTDDYLNQFIVYRWGHTAISSFSDISDFISEFGPDKLLIDSMAGIRQLGASLKKFYEFLYAAKVIDDKQFKIVKEEISTGVELGSNNLEMSDFLFW